MDVGIVGGSGYGGAELLRLLAAHPILKVRLVAARSAAGRALAGVFPHLAGVGQLPERLTPVEVDRFDGCDVVFLATPHEASLELAPALADRVGVVVDLSGAFRLDGATFAAWYGLAHPAPDLAPAAYGLPELFRETIAGARLIANPGCYPTAALLALAPLGGLVEPASVVVVGLSGTSGAGSGLREDLHASHAAHNVTAYGAPGHRHTPEIEAGWSAVRGGDAVPVSFTPHLLPVSRGLLCTLSATLVHDSRAPRVRDAYAGAYGAEPFVHLLPDGTWPATTHVRGGNAAHVGVAVDRRSGRVTASCAIDNLVKGAAGQAVQNANLALGLPEATGLPAGGVYP